MKTNNTNNNIITYRNAVYQGSINPHNQTRNQFGILYMAKTHEFIVCNNWHHDLLEGQTLFFNHDQKFVYGTWINNIPQGFNVFRMADVLVMTEFRRGKLIKNTPLLIVFEKYNLAAIMIVTNEPEGLDDLQLQLYEKRQVFTSDDVKQLFDVCEWPQDYFTNNQTLIKYISYKLTKQLAQQLSNVPQKNETKIITDNPCKLRLIENKYYRFGYDDGLAIMFDDNFNRVSVGSHFKSKLKSQLGIEFSNRGLFSSIEGVRMKQKGKIIKVNHNQQTQKSQLLRTAIKKQLLKEQQQNYKNEKQQTHIKFIDNSKIPDTTKTNLLTGINFCNKFYKNPSKLFEFFIQNIINQTSVRNVIAGSLTTRKLYEESLQFSRIQSVKSVHNKNNYISNQQQLLFQNSNQDQQNKNSRQKQNVTSSRLSKKKILQDRLRLQTIKKQIFQSLQHKKNIIQKQIRNEEYQREIINKDMVNGSTGLKSRMEYNTPQRPLDKSRSRKRIFQESQRNLKMLKDFTPSKSQPYLLSPFKSKMKNRIFDQQHQQYGRYQKLSQKNDKRSQNYRNTSESRTKTNKKSQQKTRDNYYNNQESIQIRPGVLKEFNKFSSSDSLDDNGGRSQSFQRSHKGVKGGQKQEKRQHVFSLNDYHVSFQDNNNTIGNNNREDNDMRSRVSSSKKNTNYVPISTAQIKQKKRSSVGKNFIYIQNGDYGSNEFNSRMKKQSRIQNERQDGRRGKQEYDSRFNVRKIQTQEQQQQQQSKQPQINNDNNSNNKNLSMGKQDSRSRSNRKSRNSLEVTLRDHHHGMMDENQQQNQQQQHQKQEERIQRNQNKIQENIYDNRQYKLKPNQNSSYRNQYHQQKERNNQNVNNNSHNKTQNHQKTAIFNEDTFKQPSIAEYDQQHQEYYDDYIEQKDTHSQNKEKSNQKSTSFKHSNQVYLDEFYKNNPKHNSKNKIVTDTQTKRKPFQYTVIKTNNKSPLKQDKSNSRQTSFGGTGGGISYMQKHQFKKSIEKEIQKSPDRHRCYGRSDNTPYLQVSPQQYGYKRQQSYVNNDSNKKSNSSFRRAQIYQYEDSGYKIRNNEVSKTIRNNYSGKLF